MKFTDEEILAGRKLVAKEAANTLALGDQILRVVPMGATKANTDAVRTVSEYAEQIGLDPDRAWEYRETAAATSPELRKAAKDSGVTVSYSAYRLAMGRNDKLIAFLGLKKTKERGRVVIKDLREYLKLKPVHRTSQGLEAQLADPVAKAKIIDRLSDDDEVVNEIAHKNYEKKQEKTKASKAAVEKDVKDVQKSALFAQINAGIGISTSKVTDVLKGLKDVSLDEDLTQEERDLLESKFASLDMQVKALGLALGVSVVDWDAALTEMEG